MQRLFYLVTVPQSYGELLKSKCDVGPRSNPFVEGMQHELLAPIMQRQFAWPQDMKN